MRKTFVTVALFICSIPAFLNAQYNVKTFGAAGDGKVLDTRSIQLAINKAYESGGGVVDIPPGTYKIGSLILKDNINLHLQAGAVLVGSPDYRDYTEVAQKYESRTKELYAKYFMVFAEDAKNISITGTGTIHGNGLQHFLEVRPQNLRPFMVRLVNCNNITIRDVKFLEAANWTLHLLGCRDVDIDGIVIENAGEGNRDGLDIDGCQRVTVANSRFSTTDDAIVMKATNDVLCQDIAITNCILRSHGSAIKTGTESNGGFKNITVSNCVIKDIPVHAGIELITVDGGMMQNILLENISMDNVATPVFIKIGNRARPYKQGQYVNAIEDVKNIFLNNITVTNAKLPSSIMGLHSKKIKNVSVNNYSVRYRYTQESIPYNKVPFEEFSYPMALMYKNLPAYGLYCRNVEELRLQNIIMYSTENEKRPALTFDRIDNLELYAVKANVKNGVTPMIYLRNTENVMGSFCRSLDAGETLFEVEEESNQKLLLSNNLLHQDQREFVKVKALPDAPIFEDFKTEIKYSIDKGEIHKGLYTHNLNLNPLKVNLNITKRGSLQLCLLTKNDSSRPEKISIKYEGIMQEFTIDWNEWGWAPITLLKEYEDDKKVDFEIIANESKTNLSVSKVYLRYQDVSITD